MSIIQSTWEGVNQPDDEKRQSLCFYNWKYDYLQQGLKLLLEKVEHLQQQATNFGVQTPVYAEEIYRLRQMIDWGEKALADNSGLIEDVSSIASIRFLKAGLLLLINAKETNKPSNIPPRILAPLNEEIDKLLKLSESKSFERLKPADVYFDVTHGTASQTTTSAIKTQVSQGDGVLLFYCYSRKDRSLRDKVQTHLSALKRQDLIKEWHDREIVAGQVWEEEIDANLNHARIILLLVSATFIQSDYCYGIEMKRALERHALGECIVIPVILRDCDWQHTPFAKLQALPDGGRAVTGRGWKNSDEAFSNIADGIRKVVGTIRSEQ